MHFSWISPEMRSSVTSIISWYFSTLAYNSIGSYLGYYIVFDIMFKLDFHRYICTQSQF